eukprot:2515402-Pyramimonas_sp.AAC.1
MPPSPAPSHAYTSLSHVPLPCINMHLSIDPYLHHAVMEPHFARECARRSTSKLPPTRVEYVQQASSHRRNTSVSPRAFVPAHCCRTAAELQHARDV